MGGAVPVFGCKLPIHPNLLLMIVLITGATSGIGQACAERFSREGHRLILTGRRQDRLNALAAALPGECLCLCFDVRDLEATQNALGNLPPEWAEVDVLINNAGLAVGRGPLQDGTIDDWERMIDTNLKGLLYVSRTITPGMAARKRGHVINISSIAGKEVYAGGNVYCATKHGVDALSQAMRMDLLPFRIRVTNIAPGMVDTEFSLVRFKGDRQKADAVYEGLKPLTGADVAEVIFYAATLPAHVCLNDIVVMPTCQASATQVWREAQ